eukprot:1165975-Amphidinium_carterae.1
MRLACQVYAQVFEESREVVLELADLRLRQGTTCAITKMYHWEIRPNCIYTVLRKEKTLE